MSARTSTTSDPSWIWTSSESVGIRIGVDPLGGASVTYWGRIAERYGIDIEVVNDVVDPTFRFMPLDWDGKIRMDCSSPYAMATLIALKDRFDIAFGNDPDADRHGIVTPSAGLMNPNHYLAAAIFYLFTNRPAWPADAAIGKTLVSSSVIDRVATKVGRALVEVPVGFKWFVHGLLDGSLGFGGEESAGASFLRRDGSVWTTDKDGIIMNLLALELTAPHRPQPVRPVRLSHRRARCTGVRAHRRTGDAGRESHSRELVAGRSRGLHTGRRSDHHAEHHCPRQRCEPWRPQGCHRPRMVRRASIRDRGCLQAVRGKFSRPRAPQADSG